MLTIKVKYLIKIWETKIYVLEVENAHEGYGN